MAGQENSPYRLQEQVGFVLRLAGQRHAAIFQASAPRNLTPTQFTAVVKLLQLGECSQNELGRQTAMDVATIKGVIDRLGRKGLVEISPDPNDKRRSLLRPTETAQELGSILYESGQQITEDTLQPLSNSERETLLKLLTKIT
jgi:DNA-binding MarR family transcriptional regulator